MVGEAFFLCWSVIILMVGIIVIFYGVRSYRTTQRLRAGGIEIYAEILEEKQVQRSKRAFSTLLTFQYTPFGGDRPIKHKQIVENHIMAKIRLPDGTIPVRYLPDKPEVVMVGGAEMGGLAFLAGLTFGVSMIGLGGWLCYQVFAG